MSATYHCDRCNSQIYNGKRGEYQVEGIHLPIWRPNMITGGPVVNDWDRLHLCDECVKSLRDWVARKVS